LRKTFWHYNMRLNEHRIEYLHMICFQTTVVSAADCYITL